MSSSIIVLAEMVTEHYTFRALGSGKDSAKRAILRGWKEHIKSWEDQHKKPWDGYTVNEIEEWYGINTFPLEINECLRDDFVLNIR